jgi:tRNA1(Val) A37 N6-methylase TrmN6
VKNLQFSLFEMQKSLADLSEKTAKLNDFDCFETVNCKLQEIPERYRESFSLVLCNPPYERGGLENDEYEKAVCRKEITINLAEIAKAAAFALKFGGRLAMVHRADRLTEICYTLKKVNIEVKKIQFVAGRAGAKPYLVLIEGVKGGKPATEILPPIVN